MTRRPNDRNFLHQMIIILNYEFDVTIFIFIIYFKLLSLLFSSSIDIRIHLGFESNIKKCAKKKHAQIKNNQKIR